jgi:DNA-binding transcriptional MerR regulator
LKKFSRRWEPPGHLKNKEFLSKQAGSFSGVGQRTVQTWTEKGLIKPYADTTGTGQRRKYDILNCIEIGIVEALARERLGLKLIRRIMDFLRSQLRDSGALLWLLEKDEAYLIVRMRDGEYDFVLGADRRGPSDYLSITVRDWRQLSIPKGYEKAITINLSYIRDRVLDKMG